MANALISASIAALIAYFGAEIGASWTIGREPELARYWRAGISACPCFAFASTACLRIAIEALEDAGYQVQDIRIKTAFAFAMAYLATSASSVLSHALTRGPARSGGHWLGWNLIVALSAAIGVSSHWPLSHPGR